MKKIILTLFFLFTIFTLSDITKSNAENIIVSNDINELHEKLNKLERKIFVDNLIQHIEFESEIIIPSYINIKYVEFTYNLANKLNIPTRLIFRLMFRESSFNDTIKSCKGAYGLMQLMPDTRSEYAKLLRVDTLKYDKNQEDIYISLNFIKELHNYWVKMGNSDYYSWKLCLASYNAGRGKVCKYNGIPPIKETQDFVNFISKSHSNPEFYLKYIKKYENKTNVGS